MGTAKDSKTKISNKILTYHGPIVVSNLVREKFSSRNRPSPTEVQEVMQSLEEEGLGYLVCVGSTVTYVKELAEHVCESVLERHELTIEEYSRWFSKQNMDVSNKLRERLMAVDENARRVLESVE